MSHVEILNADWNALRPHLTQPRSTVELMRLSGITVGRVSRAMNSAEAAKFVRRVGRRVNGSRSIWVWELI